MRDRRPPRAAEWSTSSARVVGWSPDRVGRMIRDARTWPDWQPEITRTQGSPSLQPGDVVQGDAEMLGFKVAGRADITATEESSVEQDVIVGIRMKVTYGFTPAPGGTLVTHTLEAELPRGLSGRVLSLFLRFRLRRMQQRLLDNLELAEPAP